MLSRSASPPNSMLEIPCTVYWDPLWEEGNKGFIISHQLHMACVAISSYRSSGIFLMMLIVTLLTRSAFSCGNDRKSLFGLATDVRKYQCPKKKGSRYL